MTDKKKKNWYRIVVYIDGREVNTKFGPPDEMQEYRTEILENAKKLDLEMDRLRILHMTNKKLTWETYERKEEKKEPVT